MVGERFEMDRRYFGKLPLMGNSWTDGRTLLYRSEDALENRQTDPPFFLTNYYLSLVLCADSFLGSTIQYSGLCAKTGKIVEQPGPGVKRISGYPICSNHSINLISSGVTALFVPYLFQYYYLGNDFVFKT